MLDEFRQGTDSLAAALKRSRRRLLVSVRSIHAPIVNLASAAYHALHKTQLEAYDAIEPRVEFREAVERFAAYSRSRSSRYRAFARKAAFRLLVPRNRLLHSACHGRHERKPSGANPARLIFMARYWSPQGGSFIPFVRRALETALERGWKASP